MNKINLPLIIDKKYMYHFVPYIFNTCRVLHVNTFSVIDIFYRYISRNAVLYKDYNLILYMVIIIVDKIYNDNDNCTTIFAYFTDYTYAYLCSMIFKILHSINFELLGNDGCISCIKYKSEKEKLLWIIILSNPDMLLFENNILNLSINNIIYSQYNNDETVINCNENIIRTFDEFKIYTNKFQNTDLNKNILLELDKLLVEPVNNLFFYNMFNEKFSYKIKPVNYDSYKIYTNHIFEIELISRGTYGSVIKGYDFMRKKNIAIKKFNDKFSSIREIAITQMLKHPNIIKYNYSWLQNNRVFMSMALEGLTLYDIMGKNLLYVQESFYNIVRDITSALVYIHGKNICHRDIKPDNILYGRKSQKWILSDFGIAHLSYYENQPKYREPYLFARMYRAPEILKGNPCEFASDIWAFGYILSQILFKKDIFGFESIKNEDKDSFSKRRYESILSFTGTNLEKTPKINLILSMLNTDINKRINGVEILKELEKI